MEVLNAVGLTPLSVLCDRRTEPRKVLSLPPNPLKNSTIANLRSNNSCNVSRSLKSSLVLLSSVLGTKFANALTYEEALQLSVDTPTPLDANGIVDSLSNFALDNPVVIAGGIAVLVVPLLVSQLLTKPKPWGAESAKSAYAKLADDDAAQLLDIRPPAELRQVGRPDIRGLKKKPVTVVYKGDDKLGFLNKLSLRFKEPENTTLFILDRFDGNSELVAELVTANGYKAAYAIKDGAEGPRGWMNSGLPWIVPNKGPSLDLSNLTDAISDAFGEDADAVSVALGLAAATGLGLLAFSEVETLLQLLGSAALVQVFSKKLLFAEDRKKTLKEVGEFLNTKVTPKELVDEIKQIGNAFLPFGGGSRALPAPAEASSTAVAAAVADTTVEKAESVSQVNDIPQKEEVAADSTPEVNSVPKAEVKVDSVPEISRPLSPYPNYPDLKPPSSPMPSQP